MVTLTFGELSQGPLGKCGQQDPGPGVAPCSPVMQCLHPPITHTQVPPFTHLGMWWRCTQRPGFLTCSSLTGV